FSSAREPRLTGDHEERRAPARRSNSDSSSRQTPTLLLCFALLLCFVCASARRMRAALGSPPGAASARRIRPRRGACTMHALRRTYRDVRPANPGVRSRTWRAGCPEGATDRGVLSFGYFSLHEQRKVTRSPEGSGSF